MYICIYIYTQHNISDNITALSLQFAGVAATNGGAAALADKTKRRYITARKKAKSTMKMLVVDTEREEALNLVCVRN